VTTSANLDQLDAACGVGSAQKRTICSGITALVFGSIIEAIFSDEK
jgi:hypothetical protein